MKTKLFILTICVVLLSLGATAKIKNGQALKGNSLTSKGDYTITFSTDQMMVSNQAVKTYDLAYENGEKHAHIGVVPGEKCMDFIVRTADFEIQYTCNNGVFGVNRINENYQQIPKKAMDIKIDRANYLAQRVICTTKKSEDELLGLIACYFPNLVNERAEASL
jgi:hypothetical protein